MRRTLRLSVLFLLLSAMLSGCIIWPGWYEDEGYYHGGHHEHGREHGRERGGERWHDERR